MAVKIADFIEAPNSGGNYRKVLLVVHVTVSPETNGAARGIVAFWNRGRTGSTQYVVDNREIIQGVRETAYAWAAGTTANKYGIHVEHCGFIQSVRQWKDGYSTDELNLSAPLFAELAAKYGIPIRRLTVEQIRHAIKTGNPADGGICGHSDITKAFPGETTHTDPGAFFPWDTFIGLVRAAAKPKPKPAPKPKPKPAKVTRTLRIGTYNVERDRNTQAVLGELIRLTRNLDVLMLQETNGYGDTLTKVPGFRLVRYTAAKEQGETAILVRDGLEVHYARAEQVTTTGWRTVRGGRTSPKWGTFARVEGCGFLSVHTAPTVQSAVKRLASPARWKSYRELMASIRRLAPKMPKPLVVGADWNVDAKTDSGKLADFPRSTLAHVGMLRAFPTTGTHGSRVIDGFGIKGAVVSDVRALSGYGSDHRPVVATITY